ncbi:hypothetical protein AAHC03_04649 [Spirometra sp. Aus1]
MTEFLRYINEREIGRHGNTRRTAVSDNITALRTSGAILAKTPLNSRSTYLLRLNNDSKLIAAAHANRTVAIYSASSGSLLGLCEGHERSPWTLAFHPSNSTLLASGCLGGSIRLWSLERLIHSREECQENTSEPPRLTATRIWKQAGAIASLAFHPQHPILVVAWTQEVVFYDWVSGRTLSVWKFVSDHSRVRWVSLSPDGTLLYTATANPPDSLASHHRHHNSVVSSSATSKVTLTPTDSSVSSHGTGCLPPTHSKQEIPPLVSRHQLLNFLVRQPNSWFQQRSICSACSLRLCRWAGTLGPFFPITHRNSQQGLLAAQRAAILAAQVIRIETVDLPFTVQKLVQSARNGESKLCVPYLRSDPNPSAVAVIEDLPAKEFLLSRGTYCKSGSPGVFARSGICCGGHACDLVLIHRELMRNSLCRPCLQSFWRWANEAVDWWTWDAEGTPNVYSPRHSSVDTPMSFSTRRGASLLSMSSSQTASQEKPGPPVPSVTVGMCINCSIDVNDSSRVVHQASSDNPSRTSSRVCSAQLSVVRAALSLIRKRIGNVHEVTRVTYLAPSIINDAALSRKLSCMLRSSSCRPFASVARQLNLPPDVIQLLQSQVVLAGKRELEAEGTLPKRSKYAIDDVDAGSCDTSAESDRNHRPAAPPATVSTPPSSPCRSGTNLAAEAVHLATSLDVSRAAWNRPPPVRIVSASKNDEGNLHRSGPSIFNFVPLGSRLLHPNHEVKLGACKSSPKSNIQTSPIHTDTSRHSSNLGETMLDDPGMAACCKCGRIVPYTIPVGPQSNINEAICASLLFPAGYSPFTLESSAGRPHHQPAPPSPNSHSSRHDGGGQESPVSLQRSSTEGVSLSHGGVFSMLSQANSSSVLTSMQQGITNVMASLLADMGDHASACSLQDTTYRICRWELQLCGPVGNVTTGPSSPQHLSSARIARPYLPMPLNVAVSYSKNSLVVSDVRIFNDSSICLSPDGNLLGAFVVSRGSSATLDPIGGRRTPTADSLLAIFRLTPRRRRGQCIYARKFVNSNPVCLDFSPNANMLAVGLAATGLHHSEEQVVGSRYRMPFEPSRTSSSSLSDSISSSQSRVTWCNNGDISKKSTELQPVARIFKISWTSSPEDHAVSGAPKRCRFLRNLSVIPHPRLLPSTATSTNASVESWYRSLLLAPSKVSLNSLVWCPDGGIVYGTTNGLIVLVRPHSLPDTDQPLYPTTDRMQLLSDDNNDDRLHLMEADSLVGKRLHPSQQYQSSSAHFSISSGNT